MVGDHQPGEHGHDQARPGVDGEDAGEAGRALDDGVEAGVESVAKDGDGEGQGGGRGGRHGGGGDTAGLEGQVNFSLLCVWKLLVNIFFVPAKQ